MTKDDSKIVGMKEYHTKNRVHFELEMNDKFFNDNKDNLKYWEKYFKLAANISMKNLVGFNRTKKLQRYVTAA
jgi:DNA topoisomerase-2